MAAKSKAKKKTTKKKQPEPEVVEKSPFWPLAGAILLIIAALFLLLGGFGSGGPLPIGMFHAAYSVFGWAAYMLPGLLVFWGVYKFSAEDHRVPLGRRIGMFCV